MIPSDRALANLYKMSIVAMSSSAAVWRQWDILSYLSGRISETVKIRPRLLLIINRNCHTR